MSNLHISEFFGLASGDQSTDIVAASAEAHTKDQVVAIATVLNSATFQRGTRYVRLVAGAACAIAFGPALPTPPVAVVGGWFLNAGQEAWVRVPGDGTWQVSVIADTL
jgi:hypothetical protein